MSQDLNAVELSHADYLKECSQRVSRKCKGHKTGVCLGYLRNLGRLMCLKGADGENSRKSGQISGTGDREADPRIPELPESFNPTNPLI